jgi:hypothetical protein
MALDLAFARGLAQENVKVSFANPKKRCRRTTARFCEPQNVVEKKAFG